MHVQLQYIAHLFLIFNFLYRFPESSCVSYIFFAFSNTHSLVII